MIAPVIMISKTICVSLIVFVVIFAGCGISWAGFTIHSPQAVKINLMGFDGLHQNTLFKGEVSAQGKCEIDVSYRGLALFVFEGGENYPIIIGDKPFSVNLNGPGEVPTFSGYGENTFFYQLLSGKESVNKQYGIAPLMIKAKALLESSRFIRSINDLTLKKNEFHELVHASYDSIKYSDLIRRLIEQYFMMHEYVDYHTEGAPAIDIKNRYQEAILEGVSNWIELLRPYIPDYEVLNYIVSFYYNRSMVTLAHKIIINNKNAAHCPGDENIKLDISGDLRVTMTNGKGERILSEIKGDKTFAFASIDCPVSLVETVSRLRQKFNRQSNEVVIVVPTENLSEKHFAMSKMVRGGEAFFVSDERWQKEHLLHNIKLPLFLNANEVNSKKSQEK